MVMRDGEPVEGQVLFIRRADRPLMAGLWALDKFFPAGDAPAMLDTALQSVPGR
jgi:hypothetical protein